MSANAMMALQQGSALEVRDLNVYYGKAHAVADVTHSL